ncbi:hypothetical protein PT279_04040 [Bifidobacterium sp. ESL0784]|uniref:hypothetical protein n=1 Tax=Bifidobacterium sp. ESL0784 TaxID=2983231 RepID=UPI0023F61AD7|nr:hypothetical protein [Bifidobacterium sp. ESL0784]MDF7640759.1 hypothetical protein [Bifidobacterium sp. ESL0784]
MKTKHVLRNLLILIVSAVVIGTGIESYFELKNQDRKNTDSVNAYSNIQGKTWDKAEQTLHNAGIKTDGRSYDLQDINEEPLPTPTNVQSSKYIVKKVTTKNRTKPVITLHIDVPATITGENWEEAQDALNEKAYQHDDYQLQDTSGSLLTLQTNDKPSLYTVKTINNNEVPATIVLHVDIPDNLNGQSWDNARNMLTAQGYNTDVYKLIDTNSNLLHISLFDAENWKVKQVDNTTAVTNITLESNPANIAPENAPQQEQQTTSPPSGSTASQPQTPQQPRFQSQPQRPSQDPGPKPSDQGKVHRGAFCTPEGATGHSDRDSDILTCRMARKGGRLRWMN